MKEKNDNISNLGERHFELKQTYLDDLNKKLDNNKFVSLRNRMFYLFSSFIVVGLLVFLFIYKCDFNNSSNINNDLIQVSNNVSTNKDLNQSKIDNDLISKEVEKIKSTKITKLDHEELNKKNKEKIDFDRKNNLSKSSEPNKNKNQTSRITSSKSSSSKKTVSIPLTNSLSKFSDSTQNSISNSKEPKDNSPTNSFGNVTSLVDSNLVEELDKSKDNQTDERSNQKQDSVKAETREDTINRLSKVDKIFSDNNDTAITPLDINKDSSKGIIKTDTTHGSKDTVINKLIDSLTAINKRWKIALLAGINSSYSNFTNPSTQAYLEKRKEEKSFTDFAGGISISKGIGKNWVVTSGLNYATYGSNNEYSPVDFDARDTYYSSIDTITTNNMDSMYYLPTSTIFYYKKSVDTSYDSIYGYHKEYDSTAYNSRGKSKFSYIEIPLMIGYYKSFRKWNLGINTGVSIGLLTKQSGYFIGEDRISILESKSNQILFNYIISPDIEYNLNDNYFIGFQPYFKFGLNNLSISSNEPIQRTYNSFQLSAKIGYRF